MKLSGTMQALLQAPLEQAPAAPLFPCSDGKLMADNSRQLQWIVLLYINLCWLFRGRQDVAVHGNMIWYVEQGDPSECQAPDVFVVFGRPPGERESYLQWQEDNVPLTVVFEIISPANTLAEMRKKQEFYDHYGVEEYYEYDPGQNTLVGFYRQGEVWIRIRNFDTWVSKRLGIRFVLHETGMTVETQDGQPFLPFEEVAARWQTAELRAKTTEQRAEAAEQRAEAAEQRAETVQKALQRLAELSRKVRRGQASTEELAELERLEQQLEG